MDRILILAWLAVLPVAAASQSNTVGESADPGMMDVPGSAKKETKTVQTQTSLAISLVFSSATWLSLGVSTRTPHLEIAEIMRARTYRFEMIQMILLGERSGKTLQDILKLHVKDVTLRMIAQEADVDFDTLYDDAVKKLAEVSRRIDDLATVRAGPRPDTP